MFFFVSLSCFFISSQCYFLEVAQIFHHLQRFLISQNWGLSALSYFTSNFSCHSYSGCSYSWGWDSAWLSKQEELTHYYSFSGIRWLPLSFIWGLPVCEKCGLFGHTDCYPYSLFYFRASIKIISPIGLCTIIFGSECRRPGRYPIQWRQDWGVLEESHQKVGR